MQWIKLGHNHLKEIPTMALRNMTGLRELDVRGNNITRVEKDAFATYNNNIRFLYLMKNQIEFLHEEALASLPRLEWLYLNQNRLRRLSKEIFESIVDTLIIVDVHGKLLLMYEENLRGSQQSDQTAQ